jgi:hypothetical protein
MTILSVIQGVADVVGVSRPTAVMASVERAHQELAALANEMAERIRDANDWRLLRTLETYTGDGTTTTFALPDDYARMVLDVEMWASDFRAPICFVSDANDWLQLAERDIESGGGSWTIIGGSVEIDFPPLANLITAKYYYISNLIVAPSVGDNQATFTADTDTFRLDENLLKLAMIWQWKANKGQAYAEDMQNYEARLARRISDDGGRKVLRAGRARLPRDVTVAYPRPVGV